MPRYVSIPLYLLGLLVVTFLIWRINLSVQISKRLAALKAAGYRISSAELDVYYKAVPENENAALLVMQAFEQLKLGEARQDDEDRIQLRLVPRSTSLPLSLKKRFSQQVEANRAALALLHQFGTRLKSRYPVDFTQGPYTDWKQISRITVCARMLRKEAVLHTESSNPAAAAESVQAGLALARTLKYEPNVISQIVRIRANFCAYDDLERCVN